jgi:Protein of unknown function (DUF1264)
MAPRRPPTRPAGRPTGAVLRALGVGARLLQRHAPLRGFDAYVVGFHCAREDPQMQMEAHHFCKVVNADLLQCLIFDGNGSDANLIGTEHIISERLFATLPADERPRWHPHNFELIGGSLIAPGLPEWVERMLMARLVNSYGKTWHVWHTGRHDQGPGDPLPYGDAMLMWSFNRDGEADPVMERDRDAVFGVSMQERRERRRGLTRRMRPQEGVDAMAGAFGGPVPPPPPGVLDAARR